MVQDIKTLLAKTFMETLNHNLKPERQEKGGTRNRCRKSKKIITSLKRLRGNCPVEMHEFFY